MIPMTKALCRSLMVAAVLGLVTASMALGNELHVIEVNTTNITGQQSQQNVFTTTAGPAQCTQVTLEGTLIESGEMNELTLTGTHTGCQAFGQAATIDMNGCKYTVRGAGQPELTALVDITGCTAGKEIEITTGICRVTVPEQHDLGHVTFEDAAEADHIVAKATIQGIAYQGHGPLCPNLPNTPLKQNGQYTGQITVKAYADDGAEQVTLHGHQYSKLKCGVQWGLLVT